VRVYPLATSQAIFVEHLFGSMLCRVVLHPLSTAATTATIKSSAAYFAHRITPRVVVLVMGQSQVAA
jgi:hypothetical protein